VNFLRKIFGLKKILIFTLVFFLPVNLQANELFVKMTFGLSSGGDVNDALLSPFEYSDYISMGDKQESKLGADIYLEFIYQLNPHISFSIGNGYLSEKLEGETAQFVSPEINGRSIGYTLAPEFSSAAIPVCLSSILTFPVSTSIHINLEGGVGYYFGTFESKTKWRSLPGFTPWESSSWNYKGKANTIGYHLGIGFDIEFSSSMFLTIGALYRVANFKNVKSTEELGQNSTFSSLLFYRIGGEHLDYDYRVSQVSLSSYSFRVGMKFRF